MAKRKLGSSAAEKRTRKKESSMTEIDYSDIPPLSAEQLKLMRPVAGRPPLGISSKRLIAIRLEPRIIKGLQERAEKKGIGYQTLIHQVLEKYLKKKSA